jgi:hypothetical protein
MYVNFNGSIYKDDMTLVFDIYNASFFKFPERAMMFLSTKSLFNDDNNFRDKEFFTIIRVEIKELGE